VVSSFLRTHLTPPTVHWFLRDSSPKIPNRAKGYSSALTFIGTQESLRVENDSQVSALKIAGEILDLVRSRTSDRPTGAAAIAAAREVFGLPQEPQQSA
jgi:hypothetical protein